MRACDYLSPCVSQCQSAHRCVSVCAHLYVFTQQHMSVLYETTHYELHLSPNTVPSLSFAGLTVALTIGISFFLEALER